MYQKQSKTLVRGVVFTNSASYGAKPLWVQRIFFCDPMVFKVAGLTFSFSIDWPSKKNIPSGYLTWPIEIDGLPN